MKKLTFLILILSINIQAKTQSVLGVWYAVSENHLAEFTLSKDSIKMQIVEPRYYSQGHERGNMKHMGIYRINNKNVVIVQDDKSVDGLQYRAMTFFNIKDGISMELAANSINTASKTVEELVDLSTKDTATLVGNIFFHKDYIQVLRGLKKLNTMSIDEFKIFLKTFVTRKNMYAYREKNMPATFQDQLVNETLIEMGFNPINRKDWFNRMLEETLSDKEVEALWRKM